MSYLKSLLDMARQPRAKKLSRDNKGRRAKPTTSGIRSLRHGGRRKG